MGRGNRAVSDQFTAIMGDRRGSSHSDLHSQLYRVLFHVREDRAEAFLEAMENLPSRLAREYEKAEVDRGKKIERTLPQQIIDEPIWLYLRAEDEGDALRRVHEIVDTVPEMMARRLTNAELVEPAIA